MDKSKSIEKIKNIIESDFKCSEDRKTESIEKIEEILKRLESNMLEIKDLNGKRFIIPDYQRAYRWGPDEIEKLIKDINERDDKSYFLQPIIYREGNEGKDIIIDGQQRLTSIYIILKVLEKYEKVNNEIPKYTIEYETRNDSTQYLKDFNNDSIKLNIDIFHMNWAKETVEELIQKDKLNIDKLIKNILKTKFIYHKVEEKDENKIFQRINTGKIALTNGELVKAILLNEKSSEERNEWAVIWDQMEKELHNEDFWCMYNNDLSKYQDTRIDYVLEVVAKKIEKENKVKVTEKSVYWIFEVLDEYSKQNSINELWEKIRECYRILKKWYDNIEIYHLVGYIINNDYKDQRILDLIEEYEKCDDKKQFIDKLYEIIKDQNKNISIETGKIPQKFKNQYMQDIVSKQKVFIEDEKTLKIVCENLVYNERSSSINIKKILLLFNILTFLKKDDISKIEDNYKNKIDNIEKNRFSFGCFKNEQWDIEHIHAKNDEKDSRKENLELLKEAINEEDKSKLDQIQKEIIANHDDKKENIESLVFNEFYEKVLLNNAGENEDKEMSDDYEMNTLRNLTLLDSKTNREYKDNVFIIKRHILLEKDKNRFFIPICTRNVFLKYYSKNIRQIAYWSETDGNDYLNEIIKTIGNSPIYNKENKKSE